MLNYLPFCCVLIGEGSLLIQCAQLLLKREHRVLGVISSDSLLAEWAADHHLPFCSLDANLVQFLNQQPFDYLFSIGNPLVLSEETLNLPGRCAVNYHDAPLPKYAGLYASSWALLHGETRHAITWHMMKPGIDEGDILKQVPIEIAPQETALTLNAKCYEAAIAAFADLIDELATAATAAVRQDRRCRSYFSRTKKPAMGLQFHWQRSAAELDRLVRSLNFGPFPNPLGLPRLVIGNPEVPELVIVSRLTVLDHASGALPGTIMAIAPDALQVTTSTSDILLQRFLDLQGRLISITTLVAELGLQVGDRLPTISPAQAQQIDQLDAAIARYESYWVRQLSQLQPLALPELIKVEIPSQQSGQAFETLHTPLPETVTWAIAEQYSDYAVGDVVSAAFVIYLARISHSTRFDIGFHDPSLKAELAGVEDFFAQQLPWRVELDLHQSFGGALAQVGQQKQQLRQRKTHTSDLVARYPALAARIELQSDSPFSISLHQVHPLEQWETASSGHDCPSLSPRSHRRRFAQHLTLVVPETGDTCGWVYHTSVLTKEHVASIATQFVTLLQALLTHPDTELVNVSLSPLPDLRMTQQERQRLLVEWNATAVEYPRHLRLHDLFEAQVNQAPAAIALVFNGYTLTYRALNQRANRLAHHLQSLGVKPEVAVGVCIERSLEMVVALLAILKAGGAYVPLDPTYPPDRLAHISTDAQLAVVLTQKKFLSVLPSQSIPVMCLDKDWETVVATSDANPPSPVTATNLAYIIYTSGSTGKPKGVLIEHQGAVNTVLDINRRFQVNARDRLLAVCSLNFDLSVYDIFGILAAGGTVVLPQPAIAPDLDHWHTLLHQEQITLWNSAPPVMQMVASHLADYRQTLPASLRLVMLSGDWIPITLPEQIRQLKQGSAPVEIISLGGATEASIWSILYPIETVDPRWKSIPYGKPMANQQFYILDEQQQPVRIGEVGELYIGGDGVARGYHNRPDLNATKFIPDPFHPCSGYRLYRTGDLGRYRSDGMIEFLGRIDHQVKIRGFRIELGEIETVLLQHPAIRETVVLPREDATGAKQLVAYVVPDREQGDSSKENVANSLIPNIRSFLKAQLPDYMIPAAFVVMAALPLTPNGKLDRQALPEPQFNLSGNESFHAAPRDDYERQLVEIWQEHLGVAAIGIEDNFFELGGHSLLATRLWAQVEKRFNKNLPLATLFQAPTIAELAHHFRQPGSTPLCPSLVTIQRGQAEDKTPLFCIHILGRGLKFCRPLVRYLDPEQPIYGFSTQIAGEKFHSNQAEDLALHYAQQLQTLQPQGPYLLLGISFGGIVAYEMARLLSSQGQPVALIAALDSRLSIAHCPPTIAQHLPHKQQEPRLHNGVADLLHRLRPFMKGRIRDLGEWLRDRYLELGTNVCHTINLPLTDDMQDYWLNKENECAQDSYIPKPYKGCVTLVKAAEDEDLIHKYGDSTAVWRCYTEQLEIHEVPGDHLGMLSEPNVKFLAEKLQECMTRATSSNDQGSVN